MARHRRMGARLSLLRRDDATICAAQKEGVMNYQVEVVASRGVPDEFRVEAIDYENEGQVYVAIFSGPKAEERAIEYAALMNRATNRNRNS